MGVFVQRGLADHARSLKDYLDACPVSELPIRILQPETGDTWTPDNVHSTWTAAQARGAGAENVADARERGITIMMGESLSPRNEEQGWSDLVIENALDLFTEESTYSSDRLNLYDVMNVTDPQFPTIDVPGQGAEDRGEDFLSHLGEFTERIIMFWPTFYSFGRPRSLKWAEVLDAVWPAMVDSEAIEEYVRTAANRARQQFVQIVVERDQTQLREIRSRVEQNERAYINLTRETDELHQRLREDGNMIDIYMERFNTGGTTPDQVDAEWQVMENHSHVERLSLANNGRTLHVFTDELDITNPNDGATANVGAFDIAFDLNTNRVSARNLTNRRGNRDHPHINGGDFCLGELNRTVRNLIAQRQLGSAVALVITALETVNPEDTWGRHYYLWFDENYAPGEEDTFPTFVDDDEGEEYDQDEER